MQRKPMTKSLHTITAVTNVAKLLLQRAPGTYPEPLTLTSDALQVLGYDYPPSYLKTTGDDTLRRCVANVAALLKA